MTLFYNYILPAKKGRPSHPASPCQQPNYQYIYSNFRHCLLRYCQFSLALASCVESCCLRTFLIWLQAIRNSRNFQWITTKLLLERSRKYWKRPQRWSPHKSKTKKTCARVRLLTVHLFSQFIKISSGYFDPENIFLDNKNKWLSGWPNGYFG